eukprot:8411107-Pyramimonas_sp.AAC.1
MARFLGGRTTYWRRPHVDSGRHACACRARVRCFRTEHRSRCVGYACKRQDGKPAALHAPPGGVVETVRSFQRECSSRRAILPGAPHNLASQFAELAPDSCGDAHEGRWQPDTLLTVTHASNYTSGSF